MHLCCLIFKSWLGLVLLQLRGSMVFHETLSQLEVKRKKSCPARSTFSTIFCCFYVNMASNLDKTTSTTAA